MIFIHASVELGKYTDMCYIRPQIFPVKKSSRPIVATLMSASMLASSSHFLYFLAIHVHMMDKCKLRPAFLCPERPCFKPFWSMYDVV